MELIDKIIGTDEMLVNPSSSQKTKELYSYLKDVVNNNKVIIGHQNAAHMSVYKDADGGSDVKQITGSYPGLVGLDTLSLAGDEVGASSREEALKKSIELTKKVASEGAIITVSTHMPNFTDTRFKVSEGVYDFTSANFLDCKNLGGNCVDAILDNTQATLAYNAYLDIIVEYAKGIDGLPVLFRPLHENNGKWFWWGAMNSPEKYRELFQYTVKYIISKGVDNFIYIYSPNGPILSIEEYAERYPGDEYVDIVAFDYYDDYLVAGQGYRDDFMVKLEATCNTINAFAIAHNKMGAISEVGSRVTRENGKNDGLKLENNPMYGKNWYRLVAQVAIRTNMAYYLLWGNFSLDNFYMTFIIPGEFEHEMAKEFLDMYNDDYSIFASDIL